MGPRTIESIFPGTEIVDVSADIAAADKAYDPPLRAIVVGTAGTVKVDTPNKSAFTIPANCLATGAQHFGFISKVYKVGTTATEIIAWR